eukprot:384111-Rhodomonas_salina.2
MSKLLPTPILKQRRLFKEFFSTSDAFLQLRVCTRARRRAQRAPSLPSLRVFAVCRCLWIERTHQWDFGSSPANEHRFTERAILRGSTLAVLATFQLEVAPEGTA